MDILSISVVVHEVIYVPYTYMLNDICYSKNFSAYLDVHLVHIYIYIYICMYIYSVLIYEPSQKMSGMFDVSIRHEVIQHDDLVRTITSDDVSCYCNRLQQHEAQEQRSRCKCSNEDVSQRNDAQRAWQAQSHNNETPQRIQAST